MFDVIYDIVYVTVLLHQNFQLSLSCWLVSVSFMMEFNSSQAACVCVRRETVCERRLVFAWNSVQLTRTKTKMCIHCSNNY